MVVAGRRSVLAGQTVVSDENFDDSGCFDVGDDADGVAVVVVVVAAAAAVAGPDSVPASYSQAAAAKASLAARDPSRELWEHVLAPAAPFRPWEDPFLSIP